MHTFTLEKEYFRLVAYLYVTEDGLFKELPDDIASGFIKIEVVYLIVFGTQAGDLRVQEIYGNKAAKDKEKNTGGPVKFGDWTMYTDEGPSSKDLTLSKNFNPFLTANEKSVMDASWQVMKARQSVKY